MVESCTSTYNLRKELTRHQFLQISSSFLTNSQEQDHFQFRGRFPERRVMDVEEAAGEVVAAAAKKPHVKELAANEYAHTAPLTTPVEQCFDWARELPDLIATPTGTRLEFYIVVFRSIRKSSANSDQLYSADAAAHDEARLSGGLLKYWYGTLNERRECLAMCIWASREEALKAVHKPAHREAMKLAPVMYEMYTLERYALRIDQLRPTFTLLGSMSST